MAKKYNYPKGQSPLELKMQAEKEYRAARRAVARAERIAGTYDKKQFRKSGQNLLSANAEELKQKAEYFAAERENKLRGLIQNNRQQKKGEGAHKAASAMFDLTDKADRKALRDAIGEGEESGDNLIAAEDAFMADEDAMEEFYEDALEGNEFDPEEDDDWALIY